MAQIPTFKTTEDEERFQQIFAESLREYSSYFLQTLVVVFGESYNPATLQPKSLELVDNITSNLLYLTKSRFEEEKPEYDTDGDIFIGSNRMKESVLLALTEYFTNNVTETPNETL